MYKYFKRNTGHCLDGYKRNVWLYVSFKRTEDSYLIKIYDAKDVLAKFKVSQTLIFLSVASNYYGFWT